MTRAPTPRMNVGVLLLAMLALVFGAGSVAAQTFDEAGLPGGEFSDDFAAPTPIPGGFTTVAATGVVGNDDMIVLTNLAPGAQTLTFTVARPAGAPNNHNATGNILYKIGAFSWAWDGTRLAQYRINNGNRTRSYTLTLDAGYDGSPVSIGFYFTSGALVEWRIDGITTAPPPPDPDPGDDPGGPGPGICSDQGVFSEQQAPGGQFSSQFGAPTVIGAGWSGFAGQAAGNQQRYIALDGLPSGAQTLTFTVNLPASTTQQWAGGELRHSETVFPWAWAGTTLGTFDLSPAAPSATLTLTTGADFAGTLYLGFMFTYGGAMEFSGTRAPCPDIAGLPDVTVKKGVFVVDQTGQVCAPMSAGAQPGPQAAIPGACLEFVIRTGNSGDGWATDLSVTDVLDPQLTFVGAEIDGFDTSQPGFALTLPPVDSDCAAVTCTVQMLNAGLAPGQIGDIRIRTLLK